MARPTTQKPVPTTKDALHEALEGFPAINIIERRLLDPNDPGSVPILLKGEPPDACTSTDHQRLVEPKMTKCPVQKCGKPVRKWHVHYCNTNIENRWSTMKSKGYVPVMLDQLLDQEDVSDLVKQKEDNGQVWVRRGDRGKEILMCQPLVAYNAIKERQHQLRAAKNRNPKALRDELAEAAGQELGDEAGTFIHRGGIQVESMRTVQSTIGEEAGD